MDKKETVYQKLKSLNIDFEVIEHPPANTIEDIDLLGVSKYGNVCKNLFLRDVKGNNHYLVVLCKDKQADLKKIAEEIESTKLSFASPERLQKYLSLEKGSVTPLGVINDCECDVQVILDRDLIGDSKLGFHPNENNATVFISYDNLIKYIKDNGNIIKWVKI